MAQRIHKSDLDLDCEASLATRFSGCQLSCLHSRIAYIDCRLRRIPAGACFLKIFGLISKFFNKNVKYAQNLMSSCKQCAHNPKQYCEARKKRIHKETTYRRKKHRD